MKPIYFLLIFVCGIASGQVRKVKTKNHPAQVSFPELKTDEESIRYTIKRAELENTHWYAYNQINLNMSEIAFSNWSGGGVNSVSFLADAKIGRRYVQPAFFWVNELLVK